MPSCADNEPHNIFSEDLFQSTSFIDLLHNSPDMNMSCYMTDDEPLALPPMLPTTSELSSPIGGSVNVLDMINHDVMFGNSYQGAKSSATTEVTYVRTAPSTAPFTSAGDVFLPPIPVTTAANTFVKPLQAYVPPSSLSRGGKTMIKMTPRSAVETFKLSSKPTTLTPTNPFEVNPFKSNQNLVVGNPSTGTTSGKSDKYLITSKTSNLNKKTKCKTHGSHKSSSHSKSSKKISRRSCNKSKNIFVIRSSQRNAVAPTSIRSDILQSTTLTHTVTRSTTSVTESTVALAIATVTDTVATAGRAIHLSSAPATTTALSSRIITVVEATSTRKSLDSEITTTSTSTSYTVTKTRAPVSIISPLRSTYLPPNVMYSTPTIITRTPSTTSTSATAKICEQYTIVPAQTTYPIPAKPNDFTLTEAGAMRPRTRLVIPVSLNTLASSVTSKNTTTASATCKHRLIHTVRPVQSPANATVAQTIVTTINANTVTARTMSHGSYSLSPGSTSNASRKSPRCSRPTVTSESQSFAIVDSKGTYTTLAITPGTTTISALNQSTANVTTHVTNTLSVTRDSIVRPRSQFVIPIANSQVNTSTSLGYLVSSPVVSSSVTTATQSPTTTIASHTITTISSEALNKIRSRLIYNVPSAAASGDGINKPRGPVTIIANQLISPLSRCATTAPGAVAPADPTTRPLNRVVIPIMSNVHAASSTHNSASTQGAYIIAGMNQTTTTTASDNAPRLSRVVIPITHNTCGNTVALTSTTAATSGFRTCPAVAGGSGAASITSVDPYSKLRSRLTIRVNTAESSLPKKSSGMTTFTITRTRTPQNVNTVPSDTTPYISANKTSEAARNPATMTLITFSPQGAGGASTASVPLKSQSATRDSTPSPAVSASMTTATPTLTSAGNRFVIKLATSPRVGGGGSASSVTTSLTTPITTAAVIPPRHQFAEPHALASRLRTFPGPRTYSVAQRSAAAPATLQSTASTAQRPVSRNTTPRIKKIITNPAPLQIFADVVCPPTTSATVTLNTSKPRFTLSHSSGNSTLVAPQYKNTVFKNLSTIAHPNPERMSARFSGPRASSERFVLNRSVAFISPRRAVLGGRFSSSVLAAATTASVVHRQSRSPHSDSRPQTGRTSDSTTTSPAASNNKQTTS